MDALPQECTAAPTGEPTLSNSACSGPGAVDPSPTMPGPCSAETEPGPLINYGVETRHFTRYGYGIVPFIREYTKDFNKRRAASVAWPDKLGATTLAETALRDPEVLAMLDHEMDLKRHAFMVEEATLVRTLAEQAFANMADYITIQPDGTAYVDLSRCSRAQLAAISEVYSEEVTEGRDESARNIRKVKIKLSNKSHATELLLKKLGLLTERHELSIVDGLADRLAEAKKRLEDGKTIEGQEVGR